MLRNKRKQLVTRETQSNEKLKKKKSYSVCIHTRKIWGMFNMDNSALLKYCVHMMRLLENLSHRLMQTTEAGKHHSFQEMRDGET